MDKDLKYRAICPLCGKSFDSRDGKLSPDESSLSRML